jgi:hypothetical protein
MTSADIRGAIIAGITNGIGLEVDGVAYATALIELLADQIIVSAHSPQQADAMTAEACEVLTNRVEYGLRPTKH